MFLYTYVYIILLVRRNIVLDDDLDNEFRDVVYYQFGYNKGALSDAISEAIVIWINKYSHSNFSKRSKKIKH